MKTFYQFQQCLNDVFGGIVTIWGMYLLTIKGPEWVYVVTVALGLTAVVGKKIADGILPMGGNGDVGKT